MIQWTTVEDAIHAWAVAGSGLPAAQVLWGQQNAPRPVDIDGEPLDFISLRVSALRRIGLDWSNVRINPLVLPDDVVESVSAVADSLTLTGHSYVTGDGPLNLLTTGTLPGGLSLATPYWAIRVDANTIKVASTFQYAILGTPVIDITSAGSGTHTIVDTPDTERAGQEIQYIARGMREARLSFQAFTTTGIGASGATALLESILSSATLPSRRAALVAAGIGVINFGPVTSIDGVLGSSVFEPRGLLEARLLLASETIENGTYIEFTELESLDDGSSTWVPEDPPP